MERSISLFMSLRDEKCVPSSSLSTFFVPPSRFHLSDVRFLWGMVARGGGFPCLLFIVLDNQTYSSTSVIGVQQNIYP